MADWVRVGDDILNVDNIEHVKRISPSLIIVCMSSGKVIELTNTAALSLWMYLDSERLKFLDLENPIT